MTVDSDGVSDEQFHQLVTHFGERQAASMVLLLAYSNFQDRLLLCLGAPMEESGAMAPVKVKFARKILLRKRLRRPRHRQSCLAARNRQAIAM